MTKTQADLLRELAEIEAESLGWTPLEPGLYFHKGSDDTEVVITGQASAEMAGMNVLGGV